MSFWALVHQLSDFTRNCFAIWTKLPRKLKRRRQELLEIYLGLRFQYIIVEKLLHQKIYLAEILGFRISCHNFIHLIHLFETNWAIHEYYFQAKNDHPFIIDAGSNLGDSAIYFKWLYPRAKIISFEPDPQNFALLTKNISDNNLKGVRLYNYALSSQEGSVDFFSNPVNPGSGHESLFKSTFKDRQKVNKKVSVEARKLSEFIKSPIDMLKMDIEGAEKLVLPELAKSGKLKLVRQMVIEYHHHLTDNDDQLGKLLVILESNGFSYQLSTRLLPPFLKREFQDVLIFANRLLD